MTASMGRHRGRSGASTERAATSPTALQVERLIVARDLELPEGAGDALAYLHRLERARGAELDAIRQLRRSLERRTQGTASRRIPAGHVALAVGGIAVLAAALLLSARVRDPEPNARAEHGHGAAHATHAGAAAAGSGVAVTIGEDGPATSRWLLAPGATTLILRNGLDGPVRVVIVPAARAVGRPDAPTLRSRATVASATLEPGQRLEWQIELRSGMYAVQSISRGGAVRDGARIMVE